jgi:acetylornithine deacetylase/succinyl-diaminopimelate desuccinylase-like protein
VDPQVGQGVAVVGLEPGLPAHRSGPFPGGGAYGFHHERTGHQFGQRSLAPAGWGDQAKFVGEQVVSLGLARARQGMPGVLLAEDDVEFAGYEGGQGHLGLKLDYLDAEPGVLLLELGKGGRYEGENCGLEGGSLHASLITGGTDQSTIPDRCVFTVERRTLPGETLERVEADVADLLEQCRPADPRLNITARTLLHRPPMETPATAPHRAGFAHRSRARHDRGTDVVLGRLRLPVHRRHPNRALRIRRGRSPRRHRMGQPLRHQNHRRRPHPARPGLLLLSRPHIMHNRALTQPPITLLCAR